MSQFQWYKFVQWTKLSGHARYFRPLKTHPSPLSWFVTLVKNPSPVTRHTSEAWLLKIYTHYPHKHLLINAGFGKKLRKNAYLSFMIV